MTNEEIQKAFERFLNALNKMPEYKGKIKPVKVEWNKDVHRDVTRFIKRLDRAHKLAVNSKLQFDSGKRTANRKKVASILLKSMRKKPSRAADMTACVYMQKLVEKQRHRPISTQTFIG